MTLLRTLAVAVLTALAALAFSASPAQAHAGLTGSTPEDGAVLDTLPTEVTLEFSEEVRAPAFVVVTGPDRHSHEAGDPTVDGATLTQRLDAGRLSGTDPNGTWTIAYRVVSTDGHPVQGQTTFTLKGAAVPGSDAGQPGQPAAPEASATPAAESDSDAGGTDRSAAPFVVAAVAGLLVTAVAVQQRRRRDADRSHAEGQEKP